MKPKTATEIKIVELSNKLPLLTMKQHDLGFKKCFENHYVQSRKTLYCLDCGHEWKLTDDKLLKFRTCGKCDKKLVPLDNYKGGVKITAYYQIVTVVEEYQLIRMVCVTKTMRKNHEAFFLAHEVMQIFMDDKGSSRTLSKNVMGMSQYYDQWVIGSEISLKPKGFEDNNRFRLHPDYVMPRAKWLPVFERNGFKGKFNDIAPQLLFSEIMTNPIAETLIKANQFGLLQQHIWRREFTTDDKYWNSIKICMRNNYIVSDGKTWQDYIDLLCYFGKDIRNPKYVCPINLDKAHDRLVDKKDRIFRKAKLAEQMKKIRQYQKQYLKDKKAFLGLTFGNKNIQITVLGSVKEFLEEANAHRHCVFTNEYYLKPKSLVLSAKVDNVRTETIEVALDKMTVVQSRGRGNKPTKYNKEIVNLVQRNMHQIGAKIKTAC